MSKPVKKHDFIRLFMKLHNRSPCGYFFTEITIIQKLLSHILQSLIDLNSYLFKLQILFFIGYIILIILLFFEEFAQLHALINYFCNNFATEVHPINDLYRSYVEVILTIFLVNNSLKLFFDTLQYPFAQPLHRKWIFSLKIAKIRIALTRNMLVYYKLQYLLVGLLSMRYLPLINLFQKLKQILLIIISEG